MFFKLSTPTYSLTPFHDQLTKFNWNMELVRPHFEPSPNTDPFVLLNHSFDTYCTLQNLLQLQNNDFQSLTLTTIHVNDFLKKLVLLKIVLHPISFLHFSTSQFLLLQTWDNLQKFFKFLNKIPLLSNLVFFVLTISSFYFFDIFTPLHFLFLSFAFFSLNMQIYCSSCCPNDKLKLTFFDRFRCLIIPLFKFITFSQKPLLTRFLQMTQYMISITSFYQNFIVSFQQKISSYFQIFLFHFNWKSFRIRLILVLH